MGSELEIEVEVCDGTIFWLRIRSEIREAVEEGASVVDLCFSGGRSRLLRKRVLIFVTLEAAEWPIVGG